MIRFIAVIDNKRGIADDSGIPWQGKLPADSAYFRTKTLEGVVMMGYGWYVEQQKPLPNRRNIVATTKAVPLRQGFERVVDARRFLESFDGDVWVGGGADLFGSTLDLADELYLTQVFQDFHCTKFFPEYDRQFEIVSKSDNKEENKITFRFEVWRRKTSRQ